MSLLPVDASEQKKRVRRNLKAKVRETYRRLKSLIRFEIRCTTSKDILLELDPSVFEIYDYPYELALFIIMKKLEGQGYKVNLKKHLAGSYLYRSDRLYISW